MSKKTVGIDEHMEVLVRRRDWLQYELEEAGEQDWNLERTRQERDALDWVIMVLSAAKTREMIREMLGRQNGLLGGYDPSG